MIGLFGWSADLLTDGFIFFAVLLFVLYFVLQRNREFIRKLYVLCNCFLIAGSCFYLIAFASNMIRLILMERNKEISYTITNMFFGPYWYAMWFIVYCKGVMPQALWLKRLRNRFGISLLIIPFLFAGYYLIPLFYTGSWQMEKTPDYRGIFNSIIIFGVLLAAVYYITRRKSLDH